MAKFQPAPRSHLAAFLIALPLLLLPLGLAGGLAPAEDPLQYVLNQASYLGGSLYEEGRDVALDAQGNLYLVGGSESGLPGSTSFPTTPGVVQPTHNPGPNPDGKPNLDMFVTKLDGNGKLLWSTFLGGPCYDRAYAVEVDAQGYVYVAGRAGCQFPFISPGAFQPDFMGGANAYYGAQDGAVIKLSPDGRQVIWASYFGSDAPDLIRDLDIDASGNVYLIGGYTAGSELSSAIAGGLARGYRATPYGGNDALLARISADGKQVLWATFLGGSADEESSNSVRVAADGSVYALTSTLSGDAPTLNAYDATYNGAFDSYLARLSNDGKRLLFATYLGGSDDDYAADTHNLALDASGNALVSGVTLSLDYPVSAAAFQKTYQGGLGSEEGQAGDYFISKISADGGRLLASTYLGGSLADTAPEGLAVDRLGNILMNGVSYSADFPRTPGTTALQGTHDTTLVILKPDLSGLVYSTFSGGGGLRSLASRGNWVAGVGSTRVASWPLVAPLQSYQGDGDVTLLRLHIFTGYANPTHLPLLRYKR